MIRLCILIGEGLSERHFLPSLLESQMGFLPLSEKNPSFLKKNDELFWFFPFPPKTTTPSGGKARLMRTETYRIADSIIQNNISLFNEQPEIHYRVMVDHAFSDPEGQERRRREIEEAIKKSGISYSSSDVVIVENEIECWYFAGIKEDFPYLSDRTLLKQLQALGSTRIPDPKGHIKKVLSTEMHGAIKRANAVGKHFDISKALKESASFSRFFSRLTADKLI